MLGIDLRGQKWSEVLALLGPNGAGKLPPPGIAEGCPGADSRTVLLEGTPTKNFSRREIAGAGIGSGGGDLDFHFDDARICPHWTICFYSTGAGFDSNEDVNCARQTKAMDAAHLAIGCTQPPIER